MLGLLVVGILAAGSPGYGQESDPGETSAVPVLNGSGPEVVPIVTRAWAHDDFGRMVFDWPWAVAYGARIEGKTLTVMFDRRLHTTFQQIPSNLGAYITDIDLSPDGQRVIASLTNEYRLRTFILNNEEGGVKVVVDLLADGEAGPVLAQAPIPPSPEPSPEAVPGDTTHPSSTISGDSPLPLAEAAPEAPPAELPPSLPFAAETDSTPEDAPDSSPPGRGAAQRRGGSTDTPPLPPDPNGEQTTEQNADQSAVPPLETATETPGENPPRPSATPPERGEEEATPPVKADADTPPKETDLTSKSVPTAEATPPVETTAAPEPVTEPAPEAALPAETAVTSEAEAPSEETSSAESDASPEPVAETVSEDVPPAEPTPGTASEDTPAVETAEVSPRPEGEVAAPTPASPSEETVATTEDTPPAATAKPAATETPPVTTAATPESPTSSPQFPTLPVSVRIPLSQSRLFRLETPVASVFVANPEIADVQLVSSGVLFVVAKAVGRTSVAALDADSELVGEWTIATVLDIQPAKAAIEGVPALRNVVVRQLNRGVELSGTVASIAAADLALRLTTTALPEETPVENRISVTGKQQVNLEVQIAEVQRSVSETLGFNWEVLPDIGSGRAFGMAVGRFFFDENTGKYLRRELPQGLAAGLAGSTGFGPGRTTVRGLIDALATAGMATVLARPNVTAVSGETASFFSGGEYPLPAGFEDGAIIFEYKKYGVLLDFVPTIIDSGRIMLTVRPEVSQRSDTDSLTVTGLDIPVINVRRAETTVEVGDGESIVIAGLYRDQSEAVEAGLPVVKDIPLLGMLFGSQSVRSNATELIVVVTARLTAATTMPRTTDRDRQLPGRRLRGYHY